jgi:ADP-ribosyl-[dinitrogen reductase] hydrolase
MEKKDPDNLPLLEQSRAFATLLAHELGQLLSRLSSQPVEALRGAIESHLASRLDSAPEAPPGASWRADFGAIDALVSREPGAAFALGLVSENSALLSLVFAPFDPDGRGDLISWVEGGPLLRNGLPTRRDPLPRSLTSLDIIAVDRRSLVDADDAIRRYQPARFLARSHPVYRCALVAVGDADAVLCEASKSLLPLGGAFLRAVGGLLTEQPRTPDIIGGHPAVIAALTAPRSASPRPRSDIAQRFPQVATRTPANDPRLLDLPVETLARAQGAMIGQIAGDALGQLVEFRTRSDIAAQYPDGVRDLVDGGTWSTLAGQPTDDSEMALILARSIIANGGFEPDKAKEAYLYWLSTPPFDIGGTTRSGLSGHLNHSSEANGSLMRVSPLAVHLWRKPPDRVAEIVAQDSALTHPSKACRDAVAVFSIAIGLALREHLAPRDIFAQTRLWVGNQQDFHPGVAAIFADPDVAPVTEFSAKMGWVLIALRNAFHQLVHAPSFEQGLIATASAGGDTDTNAAIAGALLGAAHGRDAIPTRWQRLVLTCRSAIGRRVRPRAFWPDDLLEVTERLVL